MDWSAISNNQPILDAICRNITFQDAVELRKALEIESLNCRILVKDEDQKISHFDQVNDLTILVYKGMRKYGSTIGLITAAEKGQLPIVRYLIQHGVNIDTKDCNSFTALHHATEEGQVQIVQYLLENGANPNIKGRPPPLITAAKLGYDSIVQLLVQHGANINAPDWLDITPLTAAITENKNDTVQLLVSLGVDVDFPGPQGWTPLMEAVHAGNYEITKLLLASGADVQIRNDNGDTVFEIARNSNNMDLLNEDLQT
jgi:ankyrin repeat protein